jgi:hypothetical protein
MLRLLPLRLVPGLGEQSTDGETDVIFGFVSQRTFTILTSSSFPVDPSQVVRYTLPSQPPSTVPTTKIHSKSLLKSYIRRLRPPPNPTDPPPSKSQGTNSAQVLHPADSTDKGQTKENAANKERVKEKEIWITFDTGVYISDSHIVVIGDASLPDTGPLEDWDQVR